MNEKTNGRINISDNNSSLHFLYLTEDDESNYTCSVEYCNTTKSDSVELNDFDCKFSYKASLSYIAT